MEGDIAKLGREDVTRGMLREKRLQIKKDVKTVFCFEFLYQKYKCIMLLLVTIILCLEIVKATLPYASIEDQRVILNGFIKAEKNLENVKAILPLLSIVRRWYNPYTYGDVYR